MKSSKGYDTDLAYVHDAGFGVFSRDAAPALLAMLRQAGICNGRIVDLGCGSGIWAAELLRAGYDVLGVDQSPAMIRLARRHCSSYVARRPDSTSPGRQIRCTFRAASFLDVEIPPCRAVTSLGHCFNYVFDKRVNATALNKLFRRIHASLSPGGLLIFDLATPGLGAGPPIRVRSGQDWFIVADVRENKATRRLTRDITTFRRVGSLYRRSQELHENILLDAADVAAGLRRIGFRVQLRRGYGVKRFGPGLIAVIARKP